MFGFQAVAIIYAAVWRKRHFAERKLIWNEVTAAMLRKIRKYAEGIYETDGPIIPGTLWIRLRSVIKTEEIGLRQYYLKRRNQNF